MVGLDLGEKGLEGGGLSCNDKGSVLLRCHVVYPVRIALLISERSLLQKAEAAAAADVDVEGRETRDDE